MADLDQKRGGGFQLIHAYRTISPEAQRKFWQFASKTLTSKVPSGTPRANGHSYDRLCAAVEDAERPPQSRRGNSFVPRSTRRLSKDALQKAILRLRDRLFSADLAKLQLESTFCQWVQDQYPNPLVATLRSLECECDDRGTLTGPIKSYSSEATEQRIRALLNSFRPKDLAVACAGLMLSSPEWRFLDTTLKMLADADRDTKVQAESPSTNAAEPCQAEPSPDLETALPEPVGLTEQCAPLPEPPPQAPPLDHVVLGPSIATLLSLREEMSLVAETLDAASAKLKAGVHAAPDECMSAWSSLNNRFEEIRNRYSLSSTSVQEIEEAISERVENKVFADELGKLKNISRNGSDQEGLEEIRALAAELCDQLTSGGLSRVDVRVRGALALLQLVCADAYSASIDSFTRFTEASNVFGAKIAFEASQRQLTLSGPASLTNELSLDHASASENETLESALPVSHATTESSIEVENDPVHFNASAVELDSTSKIDKLSSPVDVATSVDAPDGVNDRTPHQNGISNDSGKVIVACDPASPTVHLDTSPQSPDVLCTYEQFCENHWVNPLGNAVVAPWTDSSFYDSLPQKASDSWRRASQWFAYLLAAAAKKAGRESEIDTEDLSTASRLLDDPAGYVLPRRPDRMVRFRAQSPTRRLLTDAVSLTLEALAPTLPFQFSSSEVDQLVAQAGYDTPGMATLVRFLLLGWSAATEPVQLLRLQLDQLGLRKPAELEKSHKSAQKRLQETVASLYSAAGGRIQQRHSRKAWTEFITRHVAPLRAQLAPLQSEKTKTVVSTSQATQMAVELLRAFSRIMTAEQVKHQDLVVAVSSAEQIVAAIQDVVDAKSAIEQSDRRPPKSVGAIPTAELAQLLEDVPSSAGDRLCALLLRAALTRDPQANPLRMPASFLVEQPDLLRMIRPEAIAAKNVHLGVAIDEVTDVRGAVAVLDILGTEPPERQDSATTLLTAIRDRAVDLSRIDLLSALSATDALQQHEKGQLHRKSLELGDEAYDLARKLEKAWLDCDELLHPSVATFRTIAKDALSLCAHGSAELNPYRAILISAWLQAQLRIVVEARGSIISTRTSQAFERSASTGKEFEDYARECNYRAAMALLNPAVNYEDGEPGSVRKTLWRRDAIERFKQPTRTLDKDLKGGNPDQGLLVSSWAEAARNPAFPDRDSIRKAFYAVISGEAGRSQAENQRRFAVKLTELRDHPHRKTVINCSIIREYFKRARLNPTFLPQLADFRQIVIVSSGIGQPGNALDVISRAVAQEAAGTLCVFLEPGLSQPKRDDLCAGLRKRNLPAAVIDDVDACRLCSIANDVEAHNFIPFLEIVFEQLELEMVSPFSSLDGQHVRMETFIGRSQQASRIANSSDYTRLFSGRKLGKSAFLRYVTHTYDGSKLPSGNTLNVIFITIAGGESEAWVVDCIIKEMRNRFQLWDEEKLSMRLPPTERFMRYVERFINAKPSENVLLVLDEADAFVEGQLKSYDSDREGSLSFRMMKELPTRADSSGMPRVRIVFSGYRVTNTRGGVWANAGDVLVLKPLLEDEAAEFLRGMLGRIGLEIGSHAPFAARRCGYQPAVLIRFGESLLRRVKRNSRSRREGYLVTYDDVLATMNDQAVMDEIRTVVNNNFQGNRIAAVIFGATLMALKDLEPGMSLDEGPSQVLAKISEIDPILDWLSRYGPQPLEQIERQLQEFIDRELLTVSDAPRFGVRQYRLRFPHFLPVLTQQSEISNEIRFHIHHLRNDSRSPQHVESIVSEASLDRARFWHRQESTEGCELVIFGSQWMDSLVDPKVGIPDRLGCNPPSVVHMGDESNYIDQFDLTRQVFTNVGEKNWSAFLASARTRPATLIGGIDLQRCARSDFYSDFPREIEPIRVGRIPEATIEWWFQVARALHFASANAIQQIAKVTAGVPLLLRAFNALLEHPLASEVSHSELAAAFARFDQQLPTFAQRLKSGPSDVRLTEREIELLRMVHHVAKEVESTFDLGRDFPEHWAMCADTMKGEYRAPLTDKDDNISLLVLLDSGLLAQPSSAPPKGASALGNVEVQIGDAVGNLVRLLESSVAG